MSLVPPSIDLYMMHWHVTVRANSAVATPRSRGLTYQMGIALVCKFEKVGDYTGSIPQISAEFGICIRGKMEVGT